MGGMNQHQETFSTLKWSDNGELSPVDMARVLKALDNKKLVQCKVSCDVTQMGKSNPNWRNGSAMQE